MAAGARGARPGAREVVDRRGASGVATIAALASSGETVLALCADAVRRRALVEGAARPARFGGGELAIVSARLADEAVAAAEARVTAAGCGVVLADWAALARDPALAGRFAHLVIVDPPPFAAPGPPVRGGEGYLHRRLGRARASSSRSACTPTSGPRAARWRPSTGRSAPGPAPASSAATARALLCGEGRAHPLSPEAAARSALRARASSG